jgi:hypothetical protein
MASSDPTAPIVELRDYLLHPGRRDDLVSLFERHFLEGQEAHGMRILGQFRNRRDPDRFVWLRGFPTMETRLRSLEDFYGGPTWSAHRMAANETMIDSSDVLLLRAVPGACDGLLAPGDRPQLHALPSDGGLIAAVILPLRDDPSPDRIGELAGALADEAARVLGREAWLAALVSERSTNTFPRLPVREGENVLVWLTHYPDQATFQAARGRASRPWTTHILPAFRPHLEGVERVLELEPTRRSLVRWRRIEDGARLVG